MKVDNPLIAWELANKGWEMDADGNWHKPESCNDAEYTVGVDPGVPGADITIAPKIYFDTIPSIQSISAKWAFTIGIESDDWITVCWYRWYFCEEDGLMLSRTIEWNLRRFWKVNIEP